MITLTSSTGVTMDLSGVIDRHAVIQASAGTGKTYTLEHIVLQILLDFPDVSLRNILLVTYTEKAAGELKQRIRKRLMDTAGGKDVSPAMAARLRIELDDFESASISTIHAFCNRVLMEFAFENSRPLELQQGGDSDMRSRLLNRIVRDEWPRIDPRRMNAKGTLPIASEALGRLREVLNVAGEKRSLDGLLPEFDGDLVDAVSTAQILAWTTSALCAAVAREKMASSLVTFGDMISDVRSALTMPGPAGRALLERLRKRFMFGIVDEFQDTDPDQWDIFRTVFVEGGGPNRLIVVGDPKQAIYGFRGADLRTYLSACSEIERRGGNILSLQTNYRSSVPMIEGFNGIFRDTGWFGTDIECPELLAPADGRPQDLLADASGRAAVVPVHIMRPGEKGKLEVDEARYRTARFIAKEISRLTGSGGIILPGRAGQGPRPLCLDDICVLIQKNDDFRLISRLLRAEGIPHAQYKQKKLYESAEAENVLVLLKAISRLGAGPGSQSIDSVLLTRFFLDRPDPADMLEPERRNHAARTLEAWRALAIDRNWAMFFEAISRDTALFVREAAEFDGERRLANFRQIFGELASFADSGSLDLHGLIGRIEQLKAGSGDEEESTMARLESEQPRVRVLTIHAAKGLEFPIVFVAAGFSGPRSAKSCRGYIGRDRYFSFERPYPGLVEDNDLPRLFYVALTRAMYKLYVPTDWTPSKNDGAPICTFIKAGLARLAKLTESGGRIRSDVDCGGIPIGSVAPEIVCVDDSGERPEGSHPPHPILPDLTPGAQIRWPLRRLWVDSYSSLTGLAGRAQFDVEGMAGSRADDATDDEAIEPVIGAPSTADAAGIQATPLLMAGRHTGDAFHQLMQDIACGRPGDDGNPLDFSDFARLDSPAAIMASNVGSLIIQKMKSNGVPLKFGQPGSDGSVDSSELQFASLVWSALRGTLGDSAPLDFSISDLSSSDTLAEVEFHLDESRFGSGPLAPGNMADGIPPWRSGLLNGVIDLVFQKDGRFWFLDWKTTSVRDEGGRNPDWSAGAISRAMRDNGYIVQAHVYRIAMLQWLESVFGPGSGHLLAGGLFLFVRGMGPPGRGVWNSREIFTDTDGSESRLFVRKLLARSAAHAAGRGRE